jgi:acyl carrier protein
MLIELDDVRQTVGLVLGRREVPPDSRLDQDLGAESLDLLNIMVALEEKHGITIGEVAMAEAATVRDLHRLANASPRHTPKGA